MVDTTREIVNYPVYINGSVPDRMSDFKKHAESFEVEFLKVKLSVQILLRILKR